MYRYSLLYTTYNSKAGYTLAMACCFKVSPSPLPAPKASPRKQTIMVKSREEADIIIGRNPFANVKQEVLSPTQIKLTIYG